MQHSLGCNQIPPTDTSSLFTQVLLKSQNLTPTQDDIHDWEEGARVGAQTFMEPFGRHSLGSPGAPSRRLGLRAWRRGAAMASAPHGAYSPVATEMGSLHS